MFNQQQYGQGNFGVYPQQGMQYGQMPVAKMTQVLSPEQIKQLRTTSSQFSLQVEPLEVTRSLCTHKDQGKIALMEGGDGYVTCSVCGAKFKLVDSDIAQVQEITNVFVDLLQSIKTYYLDIPESYVTEYFKMIPLLEKVPKFFELAFNNFKKYEGNSFGAHQQNGQYGFNMLNAIAGPGMMGMNPMMNQGMGMNPMMQQQPMMYQNPGMQNQMYQAPGYSPFVNNGGYDPSQQQQQAQPAQQPTQTTQTAQPNQTGQAAQTAQPAGQVQSTKMFNI